VLTPPTNNVSPVRSVTVDWGDGHVQDLGALGATATGASNTVLHTYDSPGAYNIRTTLVDTFGTSVSISTAVVVNATVLPITITPPATANEGLPAAFTVGIGTLPAGDAVRSVVIDWGDNSSDDLGAISGTTNTVQHTYKTAGSYRVSASLLDTAGNKQTVSTSVSVVATPSPTIVITPSVPTTSTPGQPVRVTFQIQVTLPNGVSIKDATIDFGDNKSQSLGGLTGTVTVPHDYAPADKGNRTVTVTTTDTLGRPPVQASIIINVP